MNIAPFILILKADQPLDDEQQEKLQAAAMAQATTMQRELEAGRACALVLSGGVSAEVIFMPSAPLGNNNENRAPASQ